MRLQDCFLVWVSFSPSPRNLAVAMYSRFESVLLSTLILGDRPETTSRTFAQWLVFHTDASVSIFGGITIGDKP
ncbi:unnamed protein product [Staurois parvus]|uniref:Secreted protein n=1 Tax=Staurois parvus TaxID=386267 RepID=A0ABN9ESY2_9NEOB|nr:unnamed protein product [Staurois parvus]